MKRNKIAMLLAMALTVTQILNLASAETGHALNHVIPTSSLVVSQQQNQ